MRFYPITDIKEYILHRLRFQKLPEWYSEWLSQESRLLKIAQVLEKMREIDETTATEINDLWQVVEASGGTEPVIILQRITALEQARSTMQDDIDSITTELEAIESNINAELNNLEDKTDSNEARITALEQAEVDLAPVMQQIEALSTSVDTRFVDVVSDIAGIHTDIAAIQQELENISVDPFDPSDLIADIQKNADDIFNLQDDNFYLFDRVAEMESDISYLEGMIGDGEVDLSTVLDRLDAVEAAVDALEAGTGGFDPADILADIAALQDSVAALETVEPFDPSGLEASISTLQDRVGSIETGLDEYDVPAMKIELQSIRDAVSALENEEDFDPTDILNSIADISSRLSTVESSIPDIAPLQSAVNTMQDEISDIKADILALQNATGFDPTDILARVSTLEDSVSSLENRVNTLENEPGGGGGTVDIRGGEFISVEEVEQDGESWTEVGFDTSSVALDNGSRGKLSGGAIYRRNSGSEPDLAWAGFRAFMASAYNSGTTYNSLIEEDHIPIFRNQFTISSGKIKFNDFKDFLLTSIPGYDADATQTLKNINGTFTWVADE